MAVKHQSSSSSSLRQCTDVAESSQCLHPIQLEADLSSAHNGLFVYQWQDREKPGNVPNPQAVQFQVCIQNRYKLNKKYRRLLPVGGGENVPANVPLEQRTFMEQAKVAAQAENEDNIAEQRRQHGKRVRYGEIIQVGKQLVTAGRDVCLRKQLKLVFHLQLNHVFTSKHIHVSTTQTSRRDKNNMLPLGNSRRRIPAARRQFWVACWITDRYHPCSNLGLGVSEVTTESETSSPFSERTYHAASLVRNTKATRGDQTGFPSGTPIPPPMANSRPSTSTSLTFKKDKYLQN
ncbi:hypothetical protein LSH36_1236g00006 [Paralvinella palmiformis]|uniref:Uncharacterized protein n=1 Tax=Paralvinella palmiformis TaxID=53620 RepID=A0AAD9MRY4_9ANNE|nr:hypothetical protein LSH36_1236g00006 [Paralvinella palmiformis]